MHPHFMHCSHYNVKPLSICCTLLLCRSTAIIWFKRKQIFIMWVQSRNMHLGLIWNYLSFFMVAWTLFSHSTISFEYASFIFEYLYLSLSESTGDDDVYCLVFISRQWICLVYFSIYVIDYATIEHCILNSIL